MAQTACISI